jgi:magnesium chelatase family protein
MVYGFSPVGIMGRLVRIEVDIRRGLPGTDIVGLPSSEVREAKERVRIAIRNSGYSYPSDRILINLSPAEIPKVGAGFDLPMALAILLQSGQITVDSPFLAIGELSIRGETIPVRGTLSAVLTAQEHGITPAVLPSRAETLLRGIKFGRGDVAALPSLRTLRHDGLWSLLQPPPTERSGPERLCFDDMKGQAPLKWASTVAAAGHHNIMYLGPPGTGKTMAARRISSLLPDLEEKETREVARIYSMRGIDGSHPGRRPPVRMPHHSASPEGMLGGGKGNLPGEVSLAHRGLLILDEATEFRPQVLQALREPVEVGRITISRAGRSEDFPSSFQLILTSNLCPCGKLGQEKEICMCSGQEIARYWRRLGAALLDRVDIRARSYYNRTCKPSMGHEEMRTRVATAIERQQSRGGSGFRNGLICPEVIERYLPLSPGLTALLQTRMRQLKLSDRAASSVRSVAWTLADLDGRRAVEAGDILEAAGMRAVGPERLA